MSLERRNDRRTPESSAAEGRVLDLCPTGVVLGLGGGPFRVHPAIVNLNIEPLAEVDVVGDAHRLPFGPSSFDGVHCEAVFEHLDDPPRAAAEMFRVMRPGALAYVCTPFMQGFHGYPSHFQNFTHIGHRRLFERVGFAVLEAGVCVGPAWAMSSVVAVFIAEYAPRPLRWLGRAAWYAVASVFVRPLDRWLNRRENAYVLASTTYLLLRKPDGPAPAAPSELAAGSREP
jgi:SAM-dependent methyltransferase